MTYYIRPYVRSRTISQNDVYTLRVDIYEEDEAFVLRTAVPGLSAEDLNVQILGDVVRIEGEYRTSEGEHLLRELPEGKFIRTLCLPSEVDADGVEASIENGILALTLPKIEAARPKKIKVLAK